MAIDRLQWRATDWNQIVFGNLFHKKAYWRARIAGMQKSLCNKPFVYLEKLEEQLVDELNKILVQEHIFWKQKARLHWLKGVNRTPPFSINLW